jgi:hypothetical protein
MEGWPYVSKDSISNLVDLNGRYIPLEALRLGWSLEDRGLRLSVQELGEAPVLRVSNMDGGKPVLSEADCEAIRKWKQHLIAFIAEPRVEGAHSKRIRAQSVNRPKL